MSKSYIFVTVIIQNDIYVLIFKFYHITSLFNSKEKEIYRKNYLMTIGQSSTHQQHVYSRGKKTQIQTKIWIQFYLRNPPFYHWTLEMIDEKFLRKLRIEIIFSEELNFKCWEDSQLLPHKSCWCPPRI